MSNARTEKSAILVALITMLAAAGCGSNSGNVPPRPSPVGTTSPEPLPTETPPAPIPTPSAQDHDELDPSFGVEGIAIVPMRGIVTTPRRGIFVSADGSISILVLRRADFADDAELLRIDLAPDGLSVSVSQPLASFRAETAAFAADGSAIVIGERMDDEGDVVAARLSPDGQLDTTFGNDGFAPTGLDLRKYGGQPELLVLPDGRVLAFAQSLIVRLTADGGLDRTFGEAGIALAPRPLPPHSEDFYSLTDVGSAPDGRLIVSALYRVSISTIPQLLALSSAGERDLSFGEMGLVSYRSLGFNGRLLVKSDGVVIWLVQGELFVVSGDGMAVTPVADVPPGVQLEVLAETADGGVVGGGVSSVPDEPRRFDCEFANPDLCRRRVVAVRIISGGGVLDASFGDDGTVRTDLPAPYGASGTGGQAIAVSPKGRLTVAGSACRAIRDCDLVVLRYGAP